SACAIDVLGGDGSDEAGTFLVGLGLAAAVPTVATGLANWSDLYGAERRLGAVHATANILATACYASSFLARRRGRRGAGKVLALAGMGAMSVGGWLGGHLTYRLGVGVDHTAFQADSEQWTTVAHMAELTDGKATVVEVDGVPVLLVREGDSVRALADTCTHESGRLHEGEVSDGCVTCPLHGSQFRLADGEVVRGPATAPQRLYHARVIGRDVLVCAV
ncbi:MAG: hypothetical protein QOG64_381, partial [Acidimicrobiaceae bacterium]|nr:hypothetical protein [Acidimicrobiaceae bacterium]